MIKALLLVGTGGFFGSIARYMVTLLLNRFNMLPSGTLLVNLVGCFIIGWLVGVSQRFPIMHTGTWLILATGFCGGFTTFSAFALENNLLIKGNQHTAAITYTLLSIGFGLLLCRLGMWAGAK